MIVNAFTTLFRETAINAEWLRLITSAIVLTLVGIGYYFVSENTNNRLREVNKSLSISHFLLALILCTWALFIVSGCSSPKEEKLKENTTTHSASPQLATSPPTAEANSTAKSPVSPPTVKQGPTPGTAPDRAVAKDSRSETKPRRSSVRRSRPRPAPVRCAVTDQHRELAERWSRSEGYEYLRDLPWLVCEWDSFNRTTPIDPAVYLWNRNYDSPALDCGYEVTYKVESTIENGYRWPGIVLKLRGKDYYEPFTLFDNDQYVKAEFTVPCYKELRTRQRFVFASQHTEFLHQ